MTLNTISQDDIGHVLAHTSTAPEYSDYVDLKAKGGDFDIKIMDLEGPCFETEGVLEALANQVFLLHQFMLFVHVGYVLSEITKLM